MYNKLGIFCKITDDDVFAIANKNHRYYCHRNNIFYKSFKDTIDILQYDINIDYFIFINDNYCFPNPSIDIANFINNHSYLMLYNTDHSVDDSLFIIANSNIGQKLLHLMNKYHSIRSIIETHNISLSHITEYKNITFLPHLTKIMFSKYTEYMGLQSITPIVDLSELVKDKKMLFHNTINQKLELV